MLTHSTEPQPVVDADDAWEPEGPLGHDPRYAEAVPANPETERAIDAAVGLQRTHRRLSQKLQK